ncbi:MAG: hypothetical protein AAF586_08460 [Planctomycetota bacterium]
MGDAVRGVVVFRWVWPAMLVGAVVAVYWPGLWGPFVLDDRPVMRAVLERLSERPWAVVESWRGLVDVTFAVNAWAVGGSAAGLRAVNWGVHWAAATALFGAVGWALTIRGLRSGEDGAALARRAWALAAGASLLWAVHPLGTQAVTYIVQRYESLMALCYLLTAYAVMRVAACDEAGSEASSSRARRRAWWGVAVAACVAGMWCKQVMVTAPVAVWLIDRWVSGGWREPLRRRGGLYAALAATWVVPVWFATRGGLAGGESAGFGSEAVIGTREYFFTQGWSVLRYLRLSAWPDVLVFDYALRGVYPDGPWLWPFVTVACLAVLALIGVVMNRAWGLLLALVFVVLGPTSSFVPIVDMAVEHRMYLPLAAVSALVAGGVWWVATWVAGPRRGVAAFALAVLVLATALGVRAGVRNADYGSAERLWAGVVALRPENARALTNVAKERIERGDTGEGVEAMLVRAERLSPRYDFVQSVWVDLAEARRDRELLMERLGRTAELSTRDPTPHERYALWLAAMGRADDAAAAIDALETRFPDADVDAEDVGWLRERVAWRLGEHGTIESMARVFNAPGMRVPESVFRSLKAEQWMASGDLEIGVISAKQAMRDAPRAVESLRVWSEAMLRSRRWDEAREALEELVWRWPVDPWGWAQLGWLYRSARDFDRSAERLRGGLSWSPGEASLLEELSATRAAAAAAGVELPGDQPAE